jgi:hypothetical protein
MSRTLTPVSTLETLRKEAKRWLKTLQSGDAGARRRLAAVTPSAQVDPTLRDVQLAPAREYRLPGWAALRQALDNLAMARRAHAARVEQVLRSLAFGADREAGARILARWPEIRTDNLYSAMATGNLAEVERRLAGNPGPRITSLRLVGEAGSISVPSTWKSRKAQTGKIQVTTKSTLPISGWCRPATSGQLSAQLAVPAMAR